MARHPQATRRDCPGQAGSGGQAKAPPNPRSGLKNPRATQGRPKGYPRAAQGLPKGATPELPRSNAGAIPELPAIPFLPPPFHHHCARLVSPLDPNSLAGVGWALRRHLNVIVNDEEVARRLDRTPEAVEVRRGALKMSEEETEGREQESESGAAFIHELPAGGIQQHEKECLSWGGGGVTNASTRLENESGTK